MATLEFRVAELERRLSNVARMGLVQSVDLATARVKVTIGTMQTGWIPWLTHAAGGAVLTWRPPSIGEQVMVLSPSGDLAQGVAMPAVYQASHAAPSADANKTVLQFQDGTKLEYDQQAHVLKADVAGSIEATSTGEAKITSSSQVTLTAPSVQVNGILTVTGDVIAGPLSTSLTTHLHAAKPPSNPSERSGPPVPA